MTFTVGAPSAATTVTATTGADGYARGSYRIGKGKSAIGSYSLRADASSNGASASANSAFSVR